MRSDVWRAAVFCAVMVAASLFALLITPRHFLADQHARESLARIVPRTFGDWKVDDSIVPIPPSPDVQKVLDETYDETLALTYRNSTGQRVMLSLAYGRNQHRGMNTHRPEVCYPAQGFKLDGAAERSTLQFGPHKVPVTRVVASLRNRIEPITYWLVVGDEITFFGYPQRWAAIRYGVRGIIPDGVLVRVSSIDADHTAAYELQERFIRDMLSSISPAQLPRLLGDH
jgi:EpsI family protein